MQGDFSVRKKELKIFSCSSNPVLADAIAKKIGTPLSKAICTRFKDGESFVQLSESVRSCDVFIIQSTCYPTNDHIIELLLMIDAAKRASARKITAVIPYFGYSRQDRKVEPRVPISAKVVANLLQVTGIDRVLTMDLHADQIQGFFDIPVDNLFMTPIAFDYLCSMRIDECVVVSPDSGGTDRARYLARMLDAGLAIIDKRRPRPNVCQVMNVIGEVKDKNCILVDDIIDTAGSISGAAKALKEFGAKDVYCLATHAVLSGNAKERLKEGNFKEIIISDSIPLDGSKKMDNMTVLSSAPIFAEAIKRIYMGESVSSLFV